MITKDDTIVTAFAEYAYGPGWANAPIWVIVRDKTGELRQESIQPLEQTAEMTTLFRISDVVNKAMTTAVKSKVGK